MIKNLYTKIGDTYFKLKRNTCIQPKVYFKEPSVMPVSTQYTRENDKGEKSVYKIRIDTTAKDTSTTNDVLYEQMLKDIRENNVLKIDELSDAYRVMVEYDILDEQEKVIDHSITLHDVIDSDLFTTVDITSDANIIKSRFNKVLKSVDHVPVKINTPLSVMHQNKTLFMKIRDIQVYQYPPYDMNQTNPDHVSLYAREMFFGSPLLNTMLTDMTKIYSTKDNDIDIIPVDIMSGTQKIYIDLDIILSNYICVMDETKIEEILQENIGDPFIPEPPVIEPIIIHDLMVDPSLFIEDTTYVEYPYKATVELDPELGVTPKHYAEVTFSIVDATSGVFAPVCKTGENTIMIYASSIPETTTTIQCIELNILD